MEEVGWLTPVFLVILVFVAAVVAVFVIAGLVVFVSLVTAGAMVLGSQTERKRRAKEAEPDDAW